MTIQTSTIVEPRAVAEQWAQKFGAALESLDVSAIVDSFAGESYWRDLVAFTWDLKTLSKSEIPAHLEASLDKLQPRGLKISPSRTEPRWVQRAGVNAVEAFFEFSTEVGDVTGVVRLIETDGGRYEIWNLLTALQSLHGHEEQWGSNRPKGNADASKFGADNWLDRRIASQAYADRDPEVLIVGGGQTGIALAARLVQLGVDALIVDKNERIGDTWRKRYHALTLHNAVWLNDLPYIPCPPTWPIYVPKDKMANWFESYVDAMEINFWTGTTFGGAEWDPDERRWTTELQRADGTRRVMRPQHIVLATGISGAAKVPHIEGLDDYEGTWMHSSQYVDAAEYKGKSAIVFGTGNSGHDVAQDLHAWGVDVTMVQRSSTTVASVEPSAARVDELYTEGPPPEDCDFLGAAIPYPVLLTASQILTRENRELDRELLEGLARVGFRVDFGDDETGHQMKYMRRGGGYYLNVGCSDLLISGEIGLLQAANVDTIVKDGVRLIDGTVKKADLLVLATGFKTQQETTAELFGVEIADKVGPIWGYDGGGEIRNMWRPTAQEGLWFMAGNFQMARFYSRIVALQLKASLEGINA